MDLSLPVHWKKLEKDKDITEPFVDNTTAHEQVRLNWKIYYKITIICWSQTQTYSEMRHKLWFVISSMISYIPSPLRLNEGKFTHHLRCLLISAMMFCVDRRVGKKRLFTTWCNRSISLMMGVKILIIIWNMIYYYFFVFFF